MLATSRGPKPKVYAPNQLCGGQTLANHWSTVGQPPVNRWSTAGQPKVTCRVLEAAPQCSPPPPHGRPTCPSG